MSAKIESAEFRLDGLKWLVVIAIIIGAAVGNSQFGDLFPAYARVLGLIVIGLVAAFIAVQTQRGYSFWNLLRESTVEIRKVVWPSKQEQIQTTLIVVVVTIIAAIILWLLDMLFSKLASFIL